MLEKPITSKEYSTEQNQLVRATCLYLATILGDCTDDIFIVGGLVPSLLIAYPASSTQKLFDKIARLHYLDTAVTWFYQQMPISTDNDFARCRNRA